MNRRIDTESVAASATGPHTVRAFAGFFSWDLLVVASFVLVGRDTHNESLAFAKLLETALPFLLALGIGWLPPRVRRMPAATASGVIVGATTAVVGLALRGIVFSEGVSGAFPVIATVYLLGLISLGRVGWQWLRRRPR